jgi:hypothetical protein
MDPCVTQWSMVMQDPRMACWARLGRRCGSVLSVCMLRIMDDVESSAQTT